MEFDFLMQRAGFNYSKLKQYNISLLKSLRVFFVAMITMQKGCVCLGLLAIIIGFNFSQLFCKNYHNVQ